jgi:Kef-type K+ transport system membrane component KefB/Trk K+ transport system NAD-binding subunit
MDHSISFYPLLVVVLLAFLTPLLLGKLKRLRVPVVVGEIVAGIIFGRSGLGVIQPDPWLDLLSALGFAYLMFLSGLEIDISVLGAAPAASGGGRLRRLLAIPAVAGSLMFLLTVSLAAAAGFGLRAWGLVSDPWIMGLILSTTSLGVVMPVLKERGLLARSYGQAILVAALVADFVTMLAISVYVVLRTSGLSLDVLLVLVLLGAGLAVYRAAQVVRRRRSGRVMTELAHATAQVPTRGALALALVFIALAESLGVEIILGAFMAGAIVALLAEGEGADLLHKLDTIGYGFFVPIFFINVGATFDLPSLLAERSALLLVPLLLAIAYVVKLLPGMVFAAGFGRRRAFALGVLTSARLSLIIAASAIGLSIGAITPATNAAIVLVAIVTCTISPLLFDRLAPPAPPARHGVVVAGATPIAQLLVRRLEARGTPVRQVAAAAPPEESLARAGAANAQAVVALAADDQANLAICGAAQRFGVPVILAQAQSAQYNAAFEAVGARPVSPALAAVALFEGLLSHPNALELWTHESDEMTLRDIPIAAPALDGRTLRDLRLPHDALIVLIARGGDRLIPRGDTRLALGDVVTLVGSAFALEQAQAALSDPDSARRAYDSRHATG